MSAQGSIFLDFNLPNATTWLYFSLLLTVALFFKFTRLFSLRNWDILTLFLLVPGLLLRQEARANLAAHPPPSGGVSAVNGTTPNPEVTRAERQLWLSYVWLLCGSAYFLARCLLDLPLVRRPALAPNLNLAGLAWMAAALFVCLVTVAVRRPIDDQEKVGNKSPALDEAEKGAVVLANQGAGATEEAALRALALLCHLAVVGALVFIGWYHFQDVQAGMAAATFYLLLPYTGYHVEQWHHVWPMAFVLWAVAAYRKPILAGLLLGLAVGGVYFPVLLFPLWFSFYWKRGAGRFAGAFVVSAGLSLALSLYILWLNGGLAQSVQSILALSEWQRWRGPGSEGFWMGLPRVYVIPVFIAYLAFVTAIMVWPAPKNLAHLLALSGAVLIGIQFWYTDQGGVYVLWYLPLLLLLVFRPNLADRVPPAIQPETDWLYRLRRAVARRSGRFLRIPEPVTQAR